MKTGKFATELYLKGWICCSIMSKKAYIGLAAVKGAYLCGTMTNIMKNIGKNLTKSIKRNLKRGKKLPENGRKRRKNEA